MMNPQQRELLVARISSGSIRVQCLGNTYTVRKPTAEQLYIGHEVYAEYLQKGHLLALYDDNELLSFLIGNSLWDMKRNGLLDTLPKEIDQFKVALFKSQFKSKEKATIRKFLNIARDKLAELHRERGAFDFLSCSGIASLARSKYLIGSSVFLDGQPAFLGKFWEQDSEHLESVMTAVARSRISETSFRELARTDPWRSIWSTHKVEASLFGIPAIDYTEEQRSLVCWSLFYENIYSHPNCPSDEVVNDDDVLDGWAIEQKRLRDANESNADDIVKNEKIRNSQEVYIVAETHEDARKIDGLNSEFGSIVKKQRFTALKKHGQLDELEMPDTAKRLRQEVMAKLSNTMTNR